MIKWRYFAPHRHTTIRGFLHWEYAGWFISGLLAFGIAMVIDHRYVLAYTAFVLAGVWWLCFWIASDFLEAKRKELDSKKLRKNKPDLFRSKRKHFFQWELSVASAIILFILVCCYWTRTVRQDEQADILKKQRDDVFDRLTVAPVPFRISGPLYSIPISIENGAHTNMDKHTLTCTVFGFYNANSVGAADSYLASPQVLSLGLLGGGRGETIDCGLLISVQAPMVCVDLSLSITFTLEGQPQTPLTKHYRYRYGPKGNIMDWSQESLQTPRGCFPTPGR